MLAGWLADIRGYLRPLSLPRLQEGDPTVRAVREETEEGKKVARTGGSKFLCVFRRRPDAAVEADTPWPRWEESSGVEEED